MSLTLSLTQSEPISKFLLSSLGCAALRALLVLRGGSAAHSGFYFSLRVVALSMGDRRLCSLRTKTKPSSRVSWVIGTNMALIAYQGGNIILYNHHNNFMLKRRMRHEISGISFLLTAQVLRQHAPVCLSLSVCIWCVTASGGFLYSWPR